MQNLYGRGNYLKQVQYSTLSGDSKMKLTTACVAIDSIQSDGSHQWSHHSHVSG